MLATAADVPSVEVHHEAGTPCPHTPLGSRGLGEGIPGYDEEARIQYTGGLSEDIGDGSLAE